MKKTVSNLKFSMRVSRPDEEVECITDKDVERRIKRLKPSGALGLDGVTGLGLEARR